MNHKVIARPNSEAVFSALGVYLDVMRPFVVQNMPVHPGTANASALLRDALPEEMRGEYDKRWAECDGDESLTIEVTNIPHIVRKNWELSFAPVFDRQRIYITRMEGLAKIRNLVSHPLPEDVTANQTKSALYCVEKIAAQIGRDDACEQVLRIRQRLKDGCCSDCLESHLKAELASREDIELEVSRMQAELATLTAELSALRVKPRRSRRSVIASRLGRIVPRVGFSFSVSFGDLPSEVKDDASEVAIRGEDGGPAGELSSLNGHDPGSASELSPSDNGHSAGKIRRGMGRLRRGIKR